LKSVAKGGITATFIVAKVNKHVVVHISHILCCPVDCILELCSMRGLSQTRTHCG